MSWALSCLTYREIYSDVELVTDEIGFDLLIKKLKLPYTSIKVELDNLNNYSSRIWAIGKIHSYKIQNEPFIHVDGDSFIWERFDKRIENANLVTQQIDVDNGYYKEAIMNARKYDFILPDIIEQDLLKFQTIKSCNAGIFGGNDIAFIKDYCNLSFEFINNNSSKYNSNFNGAFYALLYEQLLFSCLARKRNKDITYYLNEDLKQTNDFLSGDVSNFLNKYKSDKRFVHIYSTRKKLLKSCNELENQLELEYPQYYERVIRLSRYF
tara:strand:+ start:13191 stop:13991 length:801 start_codon:yes stop_codon:yes gene_type:complete